MKVANLVTTEWSERPRSSFSPHAPPQFSPAPSLAGSVRKYDEYKETPRPITTPTTSQFASVNSGNRRVSTQLPLSPPADDQRKCSLPSISSLLGGVDSMPPSKRPRHDSNDYSRNFLPPTPPLRPSSGFAEGNSPTSILSGRSHSASISSVSSAIPHRQSQVQIQTSLPSISASLQSPASSSSLSSIPAPQESSSRIPPAIPSPSSTTTSIATSATPASTTSSSSSYYNPTLAEEKAYSHHAPAAAPAASPVTPTQPSMVSPIDQGWQHHHYFPLSTTAPYPQNHERYVCRTCHKAFSRPSSLRIHSHSHTGEKPFRCTHAGCGKAFSVRSNMKRHERGCHSGRPTVAAVLV